MEIRLREFRRDDEEELSRMIVETWNFDEGISDKKRAMHLGFMFLYDSMKYASHVCVAEADGRPVGIIVSALRTERLHPAAAVRELHHKLAAKMDGEIRRSLKSWDVYAECYRDIERDPSVSWRNFDAELMLFIVSADMRGYGVGGMLWQSMLDFFSQEGVRSYRLRTDSDCNYMFYGKHGMTRIAECDMHWATGTGHDIKLYVYGRSETEA